jgi:hypothetical protein
MRLARAAEQTDPKAYPSTNSADVMADEHMQAMRRAVGPGIWGEEQIAMLLYPGFTAQRSTSSPQGPIWRPCLPTSGWQSRPR